MGQPGVCFGITSGKEETFQPAGHFHSCLLEAFALFQSDSYRLRNPQARQSLKLEEEVNILKTEIVSLTNNVNKI